MKMTNPEQCVQSRTPRRTRQTSKYRTTNKIQQSLTDIVRQCSEPLHWKLEKGMLGEGRHSIYNKSFFSKGQMAKLEPETGILVRFSDIVSIRDERFTIFLNIFSMGFR